MSRKRTFFERITGSVNIDNHDRYDRIDLDIQDQESYYEDDDQRPNAQNYTARPEPVGRIQNSVGSSEYTQNTSTYNNSWLPKADHGGELSVDMYELDEEVVVTAMIAGVRPEDLDINLTREMVTIEGHREGPQGIADNDYFHQELFWGAFNRTIMLPAEIEVEEAEASEAHGLLTLRLPKLDKARSTKLKVRSSLNK